MNIHTPQRGENETRTEYRARQAKSRATVKTMRRGPTQAPAINKFDVSRFFLGVHRASEARRIERNWVKKEGLRQHKRNLRSMGLKREFA